MRRASVVVAVTAALVLTGCAEPADPAPTASAPASPSASVAATPTPTPTPTPSPSPSVPPTPEPAPTVTPSPSATQEPPPPQADGSASSLQVLVNKRRPLQPQDYVPEVVAVSISRDVDGGGEWVRPEVDAALRELDAAMRVELGEGLHVFSSYRSFARQTELYNGYVASSGQAAADRTSARPGHSEHQTGLAVDVVGTSGQCRLDVCFGGTAAGRWVAAESWRFGFVVRYPDGLQGITGYHYEPWHLRYVGTDVSVAMHEQGTRTLEEHFGAGSAPDYG
ncbi:M15 family metallopeptidase [Agrococcus sp. SCSIO52902]|uniref:M15 family metallopeptidase n=1 Tax=Agrococcus sp. SCSIO52902 TaxID=2933290 RepID=UPI001FF63D96|nr:M15 family metallopeptidase [Agrococcus sp. SCSIO52902]UOW01422.1 M15 family metallopeptidase [Agrococcus sp. SCSIO52902]